ncbi:MAG: fructosamine kinase family protein [Mucilaginibacter polytrichastri]|nr:fructosamine kinase family protein [Mucilaginibacter polytrichastri]
MLNSQLFDYLRKQYLYRKSSMEVIPVSGGDINRCFELRSGQDRLFVKVNDADKFPQMLEKESKGLHALRLTKTIAVPKVIESGTIDNEQFLLMEWIPGQNPPQMWENAGAALAQLHALEQLYFGWEEDNFIGTLVQQNNSCKNSIDFFSKQRIGSLFYRAKSAGLFSEKETEQFERFRSRLSDLLPDEKPSLLHGDLWGGNFLNGYYIDPAVYYGSREADLAMTRLFGGFAPKFYQAYEEVFPLQSGWQKRTEIWNLYPLLVHALLFGGSYIGQVNAIIQKYI